MEQGTKRGDYYLGLDMGTDSVGWAVTDMDYRIPKFKGNAMWGVRLFDESNTAEERRLFRISRRRTQRRRERLDLLEMLFDGPVSTKDPAFFQRLRESDLYAEDKTTNTPFAVFADPDYTDTDYHRQFPTIYHLRNALLHEDGPYDVRLVFLAVHHIIKNRGHFLFDSLGEAQNFGSIYGAFRDYLQEEYECAVECTDEKAFGAVLKDKSLSKSRKTAAAAELFGVTKKSAPQLYACLALACGATVKLKDLFNDDTLAEAEKPSIAFTGSYEDNEPEYQSLLEERFDLVVRIKALYDWAILDEILAGHQYLCEAKVATYEQHKTDLQRLKTYVKTYRSELYKKIFKLSSKDENYVAYSGHIKENGHTGVLEKTCNQEAFCAYLKKTLGDNGDPAYADMFAAIENGTFMPKQVSKDNGVIPMQLQKKELEGILDRAQRYLPFLTEKDETGLTVREKIISLCEHRIPYYVGPLNKHSKKAWIVRKEGKIYPWNFDQVVDLDRSAEAFIENLTSKCTYLPQYDVIPKYSLLYTKFMVLNELNNLTLDGQRVEVKLKQEIYRDLFEKRSKVTGKGLKNYLQSRGIAYEVMGGFDENFKASLKPWQDLAPYDLTYDEKEEVVRLITIFGDDKKLLKKRLRDLFGDRLTETERGKLARLKYTGWSRLSREFLTQVACTDKNTGEVTNIISALWDTNLNLMQLLYSEDYMPTFGERVAACNQFDKDVSLRQMVEDLYVSPKVKRPIYQSLLIAREIEKIQKCPPKKIFIEVARGEEKKERKKSRKAQLLELYQSCKKEYADLYAQLEGTEEDRLRSDKLYLYYTQMGRCMYTGEHIDLNSLLSGNVYDIDHIFPRSKVKDDSLNNRVLVKKVDNAKKTDVYPLDRETQAKMHGFWQLLLSKNLISKVKYQRLIRTTPLTDEELGAFISRQLVETRQSTKAVAKIMEQLYDKEQTEIVYVKAALASDFRHTYDMLKCREVNDFHHAKDAYLNVVVGNVYNVRCTHNLRNFIRGLQENGSRSYSMNAMFKWDIPGAWVAEDGELQKTQTKSLEIVKQMMAKNNIRYTRYAFCQHGGLFDQMPVKKGKGQIPLKQDGPKSDMAKDGAYNKAMSKYFALVSYLDKKGKEVRQLVPIDAVTEKAYLADPDGYVSSYVGTPAKVLIPCIKYNACLSFDGFRMHLSKKAGNQLGYKPGVQLVLSYGQEKYVRNITKYLSQNKDRPLNKYDGISVEENVALFDALMGKMNNSIFSLRFGDMGVKISNKREVFLALPPEEQCVVLAEILKILHANVMCGDLTNIKLAKTAGALVSNMKLSEIKGVTSVKLIHQSITGLFEQQIELLP